MEVDVSENFGEQILDTFKEEYEGQNLSINDEFQKFKQSMLEKYGNKAKLFKCKEDKSYFYSEYHNYKVQCPLCKKTRCYFCQSSRKDCCILKRLYCMFKEDGFAFIGQDGNIINKDNLKSHLIYFFIPCLNVLSFIAGLHAGLFYKLRTKKEYNIFYHLDYVDYEHRYKGIIDGHFNIFPLLILIDAGTAIILSILLAFIGIYFTLLLIFISLPFKFYPIIYICGIIDSGWRHS